MVKKGSKKQKQSARFINYSDSDFQTQGFEPRESDEDKLWDVIAIRGERNGQYLIQWAGADENGNPWPDSWAFREDVTNDLVEAWKKEKAARRQQKGRKGAEMRARNGQTSPTTTVSRSKTNSKRSTTTTASVTPGKTKLKDSARTISHEDIAPVSTSGSSSTKKKRKQRLLSRDDDGSSVEDVLPRKKRKLGPEVTPSRTPSRKPPQLKRPSSDGEDELESEEEQHFARLRRRQSRNRTSEVKKEEEESENDRSLVAAGAKGLRSRSSGKPARRIPYEEEEEENEKDRSSVIAGVKNRQSRAAGKPRRKTQYEEEEEEEEEGEAAEKFATPKGTRRLVEVVIEDPSPPKVKTKSVPARSPPRSPTEGGTTHSRITDKRPTPPRRTLPKRNPARPNGVEAPSNRSGLKIGKKRRGPPGVRASDLQQLPDSRTSEKNLHPPEVEPKEQVGAGHRDLSYDSDRKGQVRAEGTRECDEAIEERNFTRKQTASPRGTTLTQPPLDESDDRIFVDDGEQPTVDYDDDPLPFSQGNDPVNGRGSPSEEPSAKARKGPNSRREPGAEDGQSKESELSKGTVIPPTQSQSQFESQPDSQDAAENGDLQLASVIVEFGSSVPGDDSLALQELDQGSFVDTHDVAFASSIPDPEPNIASDTSAKVQKKIPVLTPSKFKPYLPHPQRRLSSLPPPHMLGMRSNLNGSGNNELPSSIESPVKGFDTDSLPTYEQRNIGDYRTGTIETDVGLEDDAIEEDMPRSLELRRRGLELAEAQRRRMREGQRSLSLTRINDLLEARRLTRSRSPSEQADAATSSIPREQSKHSPLEDGDAETLSSGDEDEEARVRQFEEAYIDFDGNANASSPTQQEERSAVEAEGSDANVHEGESSPPAAEQEVDEEAEIESTLDPIDEVDENDPFMSRNRVKDREFTPTTESSQQDETDHPYTPVRSRFKILGSPTKLESPVVQTPARQLNEAMGLLHAKSEEIEVLKRQLAESERKRLSQGDALAELRAENAVLKKTLEEKEKDQSPGTVDEGVFEEYKVKCENLTKDLEARDAEISLLKMSRDDAVRQGEIFRDLYGKASSFADEKKQENDELLERAKRAEGQATIGVDFIRKQYAVQERKLKEELEQQHILVKILTIKDRRTGDEVRRRAALEPELRNIIDDLKEEIAELKTAQSTVVRQRNDLLIDKQELAGQLEELRMEYKRQADDMSWSQIQIARLVAREKAFKRVFLTTSTSNHDNGSDRSEAKVYVCKWLTSYDGNSRCNSLFNNVQDLTDHLFVDHQL